MNRNRTAITLLLVIAVSTGFAAQQQIEFYSQVNFEGDVRFLDQKIPDLSVSDWKSVINSTQSYCITGRFRFFTLANYTGSTVLMYGEGDHLNGWETSRCVNASTTSLRKYNSVRFQGPNDTRAVELAIYEGEKDENTVKLNNGVEVVVQREVSDFPMNTSEYLFTFGNSNWTIFPEKNFQGESWCFLSCGCLIQHFQINSTHPVSSVCLGCQESAFGPGEGGHQCYEHMCQ